ncbi:MAG: FecR domain-containing protein [Candidatus Magasanikbacteria bacterium]|nr:FecR domain-containing protein [Candidatus Magasanikbacteria bacterium]
MDNTQKNGTTGRIIFFVFLAAVLGVFYYNTRPEKVNAPTNKEVATTVGAQIIYVEGSVEYKTSEGEWTRASANTSLHEGDSVEIVGVGKAIINIDDGSAIRLNKNSAITLTGLDPKHFIITNDKGQAYTRVVKSERLFDVKAGDTTYQSVGTAYKTINEEKLKGVEVYENKVKVLGVGEKEVLVEQGNKYYVVNTANKKAEKVFAKIVTADKDEFVKWNQTEDAKMTEEAVVVDQADTTDTSTEKNIQEDSPVISDKPVEVLSTGIVLSAKAVSGGISLSWSVTNVEAPTGFKIVKSSEINPVYPGNDYIYLSESGVRSYKWAIADGKTYYFRVCQYVEGKCGVYSNNIKLTAPTVQKDAGSETGTVSSISLSSLGSGQVLWRVSGYSELGYKVVYSKNTSPAYPTREGDKYQYLTDPKTTSATIDAFSGDGVYYVRVCEYLGGKCGVYSNEIQISL